MIKGIADYLSGTDADHTVYSKDIEFHFNIKPELLREYIRQLRRNGFPICSGRKGYWMGSLAEVEDTAESLVRKAKSLYKTAKEMRNYSNKKKIGEQLLLKFGEVS